ncbi:hypothetical protein SMSP2_02548 [Limihaloglobus sulfuriphilus]|uniref:DUF7305 domain-containing protein n=1 Tax=Limihaloglobus sulfuriphilus TaxID=1851148 RepID=A0A1Q2MIP0_9BACT|nr:hypothetical protein [Limihaloglobus sulfuriphilus]AQQ72167.1 hypothetical protein SMSP2_02548 [Limihaloglobus sulfuriphilus]
MNNGPKQFNKKRLKGIIMPFVVLVMGVMLVLGMGMLRSALSARIIANIYTSRAMATMAADSALDLAMSMSYHIRDTRDTDLLEDDDGTTAGLFDNYRPGWGEPSVAAAGITGFLQISNAAWLGIGVPEPFPMLEGVQGWTYSSDTFTLRNSSKPASYSFQIKTDKNFTQFELAASGRCANETKDIHALLVPRGPWFGIGTKNGFILHVHTSLGTVPSNAKMVMATNSIVKNSVELKNGVVVPGDIVVGPGANPDEVVSLKHGAGVTGTISTNYEKIEFPDVVAPVLPNRSWPKTKGNSNEIVIDSSGAYPGIKTKNSDVIRIEGDVEMVIDGDFSLGNGSEVRISNGSSLRLYCTSKFEAKNGSGIINENYSSGGSDESIVNAAKSFKLFGTPSCSIVNLKNSSELVGSVYAPDALLLLHNSADFYGALLGGLMVDIRNSGTFYYVDGLYEPDDESVASLKLKPGTWWER